MPRIRYSTDSVQPPPGGIRQWFADRPQLPYLIPFLAYVGLMFPATFGADWEAAWHKYHPFIYAAKSIVAALLLWYFWPTYTRIRWTHLGIGALVGLVGTIAWIGTEEFALRAGLSKPPDWFYNPDIALAEQWQRWAYLCVRIVGPTLVVPPMEELFFRDFLQRALVRGARFEEVAVGTFTWFSLLGMAALFGLNHGSMWLAGIVYGLMMGVLLIRTKSLGACIVAHAVTNWTLYLYVVYTGDWKYM